MKKLPVFIFLLTLAACGKKNNEGTITYTLSYRLPDSLKRFAAYLPKEATVYFRGDSSVSVQKSGDESTTVILNKRLGAMRVLLHSPTKQYSIIYSAKDQAEEASLLPKYSYLKTNLSKPIAGYRATKYILHDKTTGDSTEAWFTQEIHLAPSSLSTVFDQALGTPLIFTTNQNGIVSKTSVKEIKFDGIPDGVFSTPAGYQSITPKDLRELPVEN